MFMLLMKKRKIGLVLSAFLAITLVSCNNSNASSADTTKNNNTTQISTSVPTSINKTTGTSIPNSTNTKTNIQSSSAIVKEYVVSYKYEDGTIIDSVNVKENNTINKPNDPIKDGYKFKGWYLENSDNLFDFNQKIISNINLIAKFEYLNGKINLSFSDNYYRKLNGILDKNFKYNLHELISSTHTTKLSYNGVWNGLEKADADPNNNGKVICIYTGVSLGTKDNGSNADGLWNREHLWPKSYGFSNSRNPAHNDIHHLHASEKKINSTRGNKFFGEVSNGSSDNYGNKWNSTLFEPRDEVKGDIARSLFYMVVRYENEKCNCSLDLELVAKNSASTREKVMGNLLTLLKWHYNDPVSSNEIRRNEAVYNVQGNRNPFIDHPEFVSYIYTSLVGSYTDTSRLQYLI